MSRIFDNITESFNDVPADLPVYEGYDAETGDVMAFTEAAADMVGIYEAMHAYGMMELKAETDPYSVTTEGLIDKAKNVFEKIKESVKKLWAKIRSFFDNVIIAFNSKIKNGKEFASKYEDKLKNLKLDGFKADTYSFGGLYANPVSNAYAKCRDVINGMTLSAEDESELTAKKDEHIENIRGVVVGDGKRYTAEEFKEAATEKFRGGLSTKEMSINITNVINTLKDEKALKAVKEAKAAMDKSFSEQLRSIDAQQKSYENQVKKLDESKENAPVINDIKRKKGEANFVISKCRHNTALFTEAQSICTSYFNIWKAVYDERITAYKKICVQAFKYKAA